MSNRTTKNETKKINLQVFLPPVPNLSDHLSKHCIDLPQNTINYKNEMMMQLSDSIEVLFLLPISLLRKSCAVKLFKQTTDYLVT